MSDDETNTTWTRQMTRKLEQIKEMAWSYTWIHRENSTYLNDMYEWISVISYSLSFFNAAILIFPNNTVYIRIFSILLSFSAGLLVFYIKNKKFPETAERHKIASSKFSNIYNNISRQLSLNIAHREAAVHYHRWITLQYENLYGTAPDIDPPIIEEYVRKFAGKRKFNPIEAAEFDTIDTNSSISSSTGTYQIIEDSTDVQSDSTETNGDHVVIDIKENHDEEENKKLDKGYSLNGVEVPPINKKNSAKRRESLPLNPGSLRRHNKPSKSTRKQKHIDYELNRMNHNQMDFMIGMGGGIDNIGMSTKCYIPDFKFKEQEKVASTPKKDVNDIDE